LLPPAPPLTGRGRLTPSLPRKSSPLSALGFPWLTGYITTDNAILTGAALASAVLLLLAATQVLPAAAAVADPLLKRADLFAAPYTGAQLRAPLHHKRRRIGGACSLLGAITFLTLALVNILQREADNVNVQESVVALTDARAASLQNLPVFSAAPWGAGIQVRITASGDGAECARPVAWASSSGGWRLAATASCGGSGVSQLVFSCADCVTLESTLTLDVKLHYSCQSLLIEAAGMDGMGAVTSFALPPAQTAAAGGALLSSIQWSLPTLLSAVNSSVALLSSKRGYTLTYGAFVVTPQTLPNASGGGVAIIPNAAAVSVKIAFPLSTFFSAILLSEKQSTAALLSSLVGLAGVFSLFGSLLAASDSSAAALRKNAVCGRVIPGRRRAFVSSLPVAERAVPQAEPAEQQTSNPMAAVHVEGKAASEAAGVQQWRRVTDGNDTWYTSATGETAWELPVGAVLVEA
jgi:hypothetical protein